MKFKIIASILMILIVIVALGLKSCASRPLEPEGNPVTQENVQQ